jgi:hypothetical protein
MGHHWVRQKYLEGFEVPVSTGLIWQFDKSAGFFSKNALPIKVVAQQPNYHSAETESLLNNLVEIPGNRAILKLRDGNAITKEERFALAFYFATMIRRVPRQRERGAELAPKVLDEVVTEVRSQIEMLAELGKLSEAIASRRLGELDAAEKKFRANLPPNVVEQIESPWPTERHVAAIYSMKWRFVRAVESSFFVTSDNPAFYFECYGVGSEKAEIAFPIAKDIAILGSHSGPSERQIVLRARPQLVKEVNRRVASAASRFVYSHKPTDWLRTIAMKEKPYLSRINR